MANRDVAKIPEQILASGYLSPSRLWQFAIGAQAAGAQGYPAEAAIESEGSPLDIGHKAGLGPPLGMAHVISRVSCLATQLTLGHVFPLCSSR